MELHIKGCYHVDETLGEVLAERFADLQIESTNRARAEFLKTDAATFSKVLNGALPLSQARASRWAALLFPDDQEKADAFAARMVEAARPPSERRTIEAFCNYIVECGGAVPAEEISELFEALQSPQVHHPLVIIEYRDIPRAGPDGKYQALGRILAEAVVAGVSVAMLVPFPEAPVRVGASKATKYMIDLRDACIQAYLSFRRYAQADLANEGKRIDDRLKLYVPTAKTALPTNPGFQAKLFYIQWDERDGSTLIRNHRVLQWVSNPARDLLIYREKHIDPEALRDAFFPVPHAFDLQDDVAEPCLPDLGNWKGLKSRIKQLWEGYDLPFDNPAWEVYDPKAVS